MFRERKRGTLDETNKAPSSKDQKGKKTAGYLAFSRTLTRLLYKGIE